MLEHRDEGVSLSELLVVLALIGIVVSLAYMLLNSTTRMTNRIDAGAQAAEKSRSALDKMTSELRQAVELTDGGGAFSTAGTRTCGFYVDVNHDNLPERVTYYVNGAQLLRAQASSTTSAPPWAFGAASTPTTLVTGLPSSFTGPIFTYYDSSSPPVQTTAEDCAAVSIRVVGSSPVQGTSKLATSDLSTWVKIRSLFNTIQ